MTKRQQELNQALEAMHFGFRAMTYQPDRRLSELGLSRIHHRVLYFIGRHPGCSVNELLEVMRVSKQYLHKPLQKMIALGYVDQSIDARDRRVRRLALSARGKKLEYELSEVQRRRFADIFERLGPAAEKQWYRVMALLSEDNQF
ncbi:MAG: helix-turn-helix domain-containing protein [Gammaproteobacteria bacterium]|jgi:DNA-binding MarR family transcriptional regulator